MFQGLARFRLTYSYVIAALIIALAQKEMHYPAVILVVVGAALRIWAAGCVTKKHVLAQSGPYSYTRNPLYLGSFLAALGTLILIKNWWLTLFFVAGFALFYGATIKSEENFLRGQFGAEFDEYTRNVPAFIPRLTPYRKTKESAFSWQMVLKNDEHKSLLYTVVSVAAIFLVAYLKR